MATADSASLIPARSGPMLWNWALGTAMLFWSAWFLWDGDQRVVAVIVLCAATTSVVVLARRKVAISNGVVVVCNGGRSWQINVDEVGDVTATGNRISSIGYPLITTVDGREFRVKALTWYRRWWLRQPSSEDPAGLLAGFRAALDQERARPSIGVNRG